MTARVAITGAAGSLGQALVSALARRRDLEIVALDRRQPEGGIEADVRDPDIVEHFRGCDAVFHLAFIVERGSRDAELVQSVNVGGSQNVFRAAASAGVPQVVYASSIAAYGAHPENERGPITEDAPTRGNDDFYYARTKAEVERWLDGFEREHPKLRIARMRPSVFLKPGGGRSLAPLRRRYMPYLLGKQNPLQVTHEDDVANAFVLAYDRRAQGAFNVATTDPVAPRDWPKIMGKRGIPLPRATLLLADAAYKAGRIEMDPVWMRFGGGYPLVVSSDKIRRDLGWKPRYPTTPDVLRELAGDSMHTPSRPVAAVFGGLAALTRVRGNLARPEDMSDLRGVKGALDIRFTGERASTWHVWFGDGRLGFGRGAHPEARARVLLTEQTFYQLVSGELDWTTATFTGKLRMRGDGEFSMVAGAMFHNIRMALDKAGEGPLPARLVRRWFFSHSPSPGSGAHP